MNPKIKQFLDEVRLTPEEISEHAIVCWEALSDHEKKSFELVAEYAQNKILKHEDIALIDRGRIPKDNPYKVYIVKRRSATQENFEYISYLLYQTLPWMPIAYTGLWLPRELQEINGT